jgi:hypothetical protein
MEYSFERVLMAPRRAIRLPLIAVLVAMIAWHATARAEDILDPGMSIHIAASPRTGGSGPADRTPKTAPPQPSPNVTAHPPPEIPDVTVMAPSPPTDQELAGRSLDEFILHHATTHFANTSTVGNLARWRGGMQSICPSTAGLTPGYSAFVTARLRALAAYVGAPVQSDPQCKSNVQILFTDNPQKEMVPS